MRLSKAEVRAIKSASAGMFPGKKIRFFLYGSRTDDTLRGGDIDLYFLGETWSREEQASQFALLGALKSDPAIGDRKINLSLVTKEDLEQDPFWRSISGAVEI